TELRFGTRFLVRLRMVSKNAKKMQNLQKVIGWEQTAASPLRQIGYKAQNDGFQRGIYSALAARELANGSEPDASLRKKAQDARDAFVSARCPPVN
ncbi:MAG: hypothetical protein ACKO96_00250, partial [Flammeovirgaceae bacterium]